MKHSIALAYAALLVLSVARCAQAQTTRPVNAKDAPDQAVTGRLLGLDGQPMKDVYVRLVARSWDIYEAQLYPEPLEQDGMSWAKTDAEGRFSFPPQARSYALNVQTDAGYVIAKREQLTLPATLQLAPWTKIEGALTLGDKPAPAGIAIEAHTSVEAMEDGGIGPHLHFRGVTNDSGRFTIPRIYGFEFHFSRIGVFNGQRYSSSTTTVKIEPGTTAQVAIASVSRPVTGRVTLPDGYHKEGWYPPTATVHASLRLPQFALPSNILQITRAEREAWFEDWKKTPEGQQAQVEHTQTAQEHHRWFFNIMPDGSFRLDDVPPGTYVAPTTFIPMTNGRLDFANKLIALYQFTIPPGEYSDTPLDLGHLPLQQVGLTNVGQVAPDLVISTLEGKELLLSQLKGKIVLLDFWGTWCGTCLMDLPKMQAIYDAYGKNPNFVMISLSVNDTLEKVQQFLQKNRMPWTLSVLGDHENAWAPLLYHVTGYPTLWLIGPDGKTLANGNYAEEVRPTLDKALKNISQ